MGPDRSKSVLFSILLISIINVIGIVFINVDLPESKFFAGVLVMAFELLVIFASFAIVDFFLPPPPVEELNLGEKLKELWSSSVFWMYLVLAVGAITNIFFGFDLTESEAETIVGLDWTNITAAITGIVSIVLRKYNVFNILAAVK